MKVLILGLGNVLMSDDGFGPRLIEMLRRRLDFPPEVVLVDGGTLGLDLLPFLEEAQQLILLDAMNLGAPPGSVFRLAAEEVPRALGAKVSVHQAGVQDLLAVAELLGHLPTEMVLVGVQPGALDVGLSLTPPVESALGGAGVAVAEVLREWGIICRPRL